MYRYIVLWFLMTSYLLSTPINIGEKDQYNIQNFLQYTLDDNINENLDELKNKKWNVSQQLFNTFENFDRAYWVKLNIKNVTSKRIEYYLQVENEPIYFIKFFLQKNNKIVSTYKDGAVVKSPNRTLNNTQIMFPIMLESQEETTLFIKVKNFNKNNITFLLINDKYLLTHYPLQTFFEALFFGGMLILMFYNFLMYIFLKLRFYLYYVFYTFWVNVYFLGFFGYITAYFPDFIFLYHLSSGGIFIALTLFVQSLFRLKERLPSVYNFLHLFSLYFFLSRFFYIYFLEKDNFIYAQFLFDITFLIIIVYSIVVILVTQYLAYFKDYFIAKIYGIVWIVSVASLWLLSFISLNIIKVNIPINYYMLFVILFESLSFSYLLAYKIKVMEQEKRDQDKVRIRQNKLASISEIISLIAHQWRQPLTVINSIVFTLALKQKKGKLEGEKLEEGLSQIEKSTSYLSHTIQDFMYLFSKEKPMESFRIFEVINDSKQIALLSHPENIDVFINVEKNMELFGYKSELIQALIIVFNNAIYAVLKKNTLNPCIIVDMITCENQLTLCIEDNGGGLDEKILENIFDPYFTTKNKEEGTGLGLYILKVIIEESMHGKVSLSNGEEGVICKIQIPVDMRGLD